MLPALIDTHGSFDEAAIAGRVQAMAARVRDSGATVVALLADNGID